MKAKDIQAVIRNKLGQIFSDDLVKSEWSVRTAATDKIFDKSTYVSRCRLVQQILQSAPVVQAALCGFWGSRFLRCRARTRATQAN